MPIYTSFKMNAKLTTTTYLLSPGTSILQQIYSSPANQNYAFYQILGNNSQSKRINNFQQYGARSYYRCG